MTKSKGILAFDSEEGSNCAIVKSEKRSTGKLRLRHQARQKPFFDGDFLLDDEGDDEFLARGKRETDSTPDNL